MKRCVVLTLGLGMSAVALARPTMVVNVHGYTLAQGRIKTFDTLVFNDGKVIAAGNAALRARHRDAEVIDGQGRVLLPGLMDAHGHVLDLGFEAGEVGLGDTGSLAEAQDRIRAYSASHPKAAWVIGGGWNQVKWKLGRFPTAGELDEAEASRPVALWRVDGHAVWVNRKALDLAGIIAATRDPEGGRIERDDQGNPTGVLVDKAMGLVARLFPERSAEDRAEAILVAQRELNRVGLTSVGDAGVSSAVVSDYQALAQRDALTVRIYAMIRGTGEDFDLLARTGPILGMQRDHLTVRSVKLFSDGALGSRGAAMIAPYSDAPDHKGLLFMPDEQVVAQIVKAIHAGYQVNVHAIGDAANRQVLNGFDAAFAREGGRKLRHRIEHAQVIAVQDIPRFKQLSIIASMQPTHATSDMNMAEDRVGTQRLLGAYAWRTLLDQGTVIAGGSDFPVESPNPFFGLHAAVTRTDHDGNPKGGWHHEQCMTRAEAFRAFTLDVAYAQHQEKVLGSLEPGKWADFILIDRDIFKVPAQEIWKTQVLQTWVGGRLVFKK